MANMTSKSGRGALSMFQLALPLVLEQFFRILVSSADTIMLSSYSDKAVAGVGLMAQYVFFLNLLFSMIATGTSIVLAQYIGAKKSKEDLNSIASASTVMIIQLGLFMIQSETQLTSISSFLAESVQFLTR